MGKLKEASVRHLVGRVVEGAVRQGERWLPHPTFRWKRHFYRPDMNFACSLLRNNGFRPRTLIDVGAYVGNWSTATLRAFPEARVLMVEPSEQRSPVLAALCAQDPRLEFRRALLSSAEGRASFREQETNSGIVSDGDSSACEMATTTLDRLVEGTEFAHPDLIKVDVQGYDLDVLAGATRAMESAQVLIVELSLIGLHPHAPSFRTAIDWCDDHGFRLLDFAEFIRRPVDDALWQVDAVLVRHGSPLGSPRAGW